MQGTAVFGVPPLGFFPVEPIPFGNISFRKSGNMEQEKPGQAAMESGGGLPPASHPRPSTFDVAATRERHNCPAAALRNRTRPNYCFRPRVHSRTSWLLCCVVVEISGRLPAKRGEKSASSLSGQERREQEASEGQPPGGQVMTGPCPRCVCAEYW